MRDPSSAKIRPAPSEESLPDRREAMLGHALDIVREGGLSSLTMKKVADRVGFTETAAYRYFPNKGALMLGLAGRLGENLLAPIRALVRSDLPPAEKLDRVLRHHVSFVLRVDGLPILILAEAAAGGETEMLDHLRTVVREYMSEVAAVIAEIPGGAESSDDQRLLPILLLGVPASVAILKRVGALDDLEAPVFETLIPRLVSCLIAGQGRRDE